MRFIFRCKSKTCRHIWAYDYLGVRDGVATGKRCRQACRNLADGSTATKDTDWARGCPKCGGQHVDGRKVEGFQTDHRATRGAPARQTMSVGG